MDASEMRELLQGYLRELDWSDGATKDEVIAHLAGRDESLRTMVNQYVTEGTYQDVDEVIDLIPAQAWQDVQGDAWRGAESQYAEDTVSHFQEGAVGQDEGVVYHPGRPAPQTPGFGHSAAATGTAETGQPEVRTPSPGGASIPREWSSALDQVAAVEPQRLIPVALSALCEGLGQAYNRQPAKAAALLALGLGLSTASGLNTWLIRRLFGARNVTIGAERLRPVLLAIWAAIYAYNLWDAWAEASPPNAGSRQAKP